MQCQHSYLPSIEAYDPSDGELDGLFGQEVAQLPPPPWVQLLYLPPVFHSSMQFLQVRPIRQQKLVILHQNIVCIMYIDYLSE